MVSRANFSRSPFVKEYFTYPGAHWKTLDNNDLNQVVRLPVLVKTRIWLGAQSRMLKKNLVSLILIEGFRAHNMAEPVTGPTRHQRYQINFICS